MEWTKEQIQELIHEAIVAERIRLADKIYYSCPEYSYDSDNNCQFDWNRTVRELKKYILEDNDE